MNPSLEKCRRCSAPEPSPGTLFALAITCWALLSLGSQLSFLQLRAGHHNASPVQEQDTAVLSLPLTVLNKALLHEPWCPLNGVSDFYVLKNGAHLSDNKMMLMCVQFDFSHCKNLGNSEGALHTLKKRFSETTVQAHFKR